MQTRLVALCVLGFSTGSAAPATAQSVSDIFKRVKDAVVVVYTSERTLAQGAPGQFVSVGGLGSGVLVSDDEVLTAAHVVQTADEVLVEFTTGQRLTARVVASAPAADIALLKLGARPSLVVPAKIGNSDSVEVGEQIFIVGAPLGVTHTLTVGHVSARRRPSRTFGSMFRAEFLQTDAAINEGNSGGPMFNMTGEIVGIVSFIISQSGGSEGLGFVVTANMAKDLLLSGPSMWSGLEGIELTEGLAYVLNVPPPGVGMLVQRVAKGSLAEQLGLKPGAVHGTINDEALVLGGDIVLTFQGIPVGAEYYEQMRDAVGRLRPNDLIRVTVLRAGEKVELSTRYAP